MKGTIQQVKAAMKGNEFKKIRVLSESSNVDEIITRVKEITQIPGIKFQFAEIRHDLGKIPNDPNRDEFYPLTIYAQDGIRICVSEVRCGYHGASTYAMIEILKMIGVNLTVHDEEEIYNSPHRYERTFRISSDAKIY